MKIGILSLCLLGLTVHASPVRQATLPHPVFADTEVSTNIAFSAWEGRTGDFWYTFTFNASPSNNVQIALGTDIDGNGILSHDETRLVLGWRCGTWFAGNGVGRTFGVCPPSILSGEKSLYCRTRFDRTATLISYILTNSDGVIFPQLPETTLSLLTEWNLLRFTARGAETGNASIETQSVPDGILIIFK